MHDAVDWNIIDDHPFRKVRTQRSTVKVNEFVRNRSPAPCPDHKADWGDRACGLGSCWDDCPSGMGAGSRGPRTGPARDSAAGDKHICWP
jgi:hypothetical protein